MNDTAVQATDRTAVLEVIDGVYRAWAANDADAFVTDYLPDATSIVTGGRTDGRDAIRARFAAMFTGPLRDSSVRDELLSVRFPAPDTAIVNSRSGVQLADQTEPQRWELATWVLVRKGGDWAVAAYHNCPA
ncbi:SgcJ/EcaC family oxidoreductase [Nocardia sp. NPDC058058]|uniref:SgcJ/EcaC family oxidoreductase n=1 Tax=Nocardia sp. NPDC058058 TaxID=3346317 RepID=UPI0036DB92A7